MKLLFLFTLIVFSNAEKYPMGNYIKTCSEIKIYENKLTAYAEFEAIMRKDLRYEQWNSFKGSHERWNIILFDECSYIENINGELIDTRIPDCITNNKKYIYDTKLTELNQKLDLILKYINLDKSVSNLAQDKKHKELEDFSL